MDRLGFVGAGRAGTALARGLAAVGWPVVAVSSRTAAHAEALAACLPGARALPDAQGVADAADVVFLTVPDAAISPVAEAIAWTRGQGVVHASGVESLTPLAAPARQRALVGCFHPLQTFAVVPPGCAGTLCRHHLRARGRPALLPRLRPWRARSGRAHRPSHRRRNCCITPRRCWRRIIWSRCCTWRPISGGPSACPSARPTEALLPLVRGAVDNVAAHGAIEALTGPIARGDASTVAKHLQALAAARPEALATYRALGGATLELARLRGDLDAEAVAGIEALLGQAPEREGGQLGPREVVV